MAMFKKSGALLTQSFRVLREDKKLIVFPLLSALACGAVLVSFATPIIFSGIIEDLSNKNGKEGISLAMKALGAGLSFLFYFATYTVMVYFNTALVSCAMERFDGKTPTVRGGLHAANSLLGPIIGWSLLAATVGTILRAIEERVGFVGKIVVGLVGAAWSIATYFVVPILLVERTGPTTALKRSVEVMTKSWGTALVSNIGLGLLMVLAYVAATIPAFLGLALTIKLEHWVPIAVGGAVTIAMIFLVALVTSAMQMILIAALYRFASTGNVPSGFVENDLRSAFAPKKPAVNAAEI
ncbi:MAG: hypothetical protein KF805_05480 [Phycisphaeraceae bacterium]|nr:hypothetical protein [Phycisphaeraceae bacterium]